MQRPTAVPRMPASARGVSTQRSSPNVSRSPAVARKTPPARPTSSPITITFSSRASSWCRQSLIASTSVSSAIGEDPPQLGEVVVERARRGRERRGEQQRGIGVRLRLGLRDRLPHQLGRFLSDPLGQLVRQQPPTPQVALETAHAFTPPLLLDPLGIDVDAR